MKTPHKNLIVLIKTRKQKKAQEPIKQLNKK